MKKIIKVGLFILIGLAVLFAALVAVVAVADRNIEVTPTLSTITSLAEGNAMALGIGDDVAHIGLSSTGSNGASPSALLVTLAGGVQTRQTFYTGQVFSLGDYVITIHQITPGVLGVGKGAVYLIVDYAPKLFSFLTSLENFSAISDVDLTNIFGISLAANPSTNPYYVEKSAAVQEGPDIAGFFKSIQLQITTGDSLGGMLTLNLRNDTNITEADILAKYPEHRYELNYIVVPKPWGKVSFGIARDGNHHLTEITYDSIDKY